MCVYVRERKRVMMMVLVNKMMIMVGLVQVVTADEKYVCPAYENLRDDTVSSKAFDIEEFGGRWFMLATTEPTMPSFCRCGYNDVEIGSTTYQYANHDSCNEKTFHHNITIHIKGELSSDPESPGALRENAALFNHTVGKLDPNYLFRVERDLKGRVEVVYTYACLGKLPPMVGRERFSFNVLARSPQGYDPTRINAMIQAVNQSVTSRGISLDFSDLRIDDEAAFQKCYPRGDV